MVTIVLFNEINSDPLQYCSGIEPLNIKLSTLNLKNEELLGYLGPHHRYLVHGMGEELLSEDKRCY